VAERHSAVQEISVREHLRDKCIRYFSKPAPAVKSARKKSAGLELYIDKFRWFTMY
jgi:hypothetical protein